jgi:predicted nucleic acid-binding protein
METTILDTDILIDAAKGVEDAIQCLLFFEKQTGIGISIVTFMELVVGCRDKTELRKTDRFLKKFKIFPLDPSVCNTALDLLKKYRLSHGPGCQSSLHYQKSERLPIYSRVEPAPISLPQNRGGNQNLISSSVSEYFDKSIVIPVAMLVIDNVHIHHTPIRTGDVDNTAGIPHLFYLLKDLISLLGV